MDGNLPTISIVMPLYNNEREVGRAVRSVLAQMLPSFELLVINDGSTDGGAEVVRGMKEPRIRLVEQKNAGVSAARNRGIEEAQGEMIAFLDADDEWMPGFLEKVLSLRERFPECEVFATGYLFREVGGTFRSPLLRGLPSPKWEGVLPEYFFIASRSDPPLWTSAVAVRKRAILAAGGFPLGVSSGEDLLTWARLAVSFPIAYSTEPKAIFWLRAPIAGSPTRSPDAADLVGQSLDALLREIDPARARYLKRYIALWHRMRAFMYLECGQRRQAWHEIYQMARFSKLNVELYIYAALALLPPSLERVSMRHLNNMKIRRRQRLNLHQRDH